MAISSEALIVRAERRSDDDHDDDGMHKPAAIDEEEDNVTIMEFDDAVNLLGIGRWYILVVGGLAITSAAMSMSQNLLSLLTDCVGEDWNLSSSEAATVNSVMFLSSGLGSLFVGPWSDKFGRRSALILLTGAFTIFSMASIFSFNLAWLIVMRALVGFCIGGATMPLVYIEEIAPAAHRGFLTTCCIIFWGLGNVFISGAAWVIYPLTPLSIGWRLLLAFTAAFGLLASLFLVAWLYESPRWLLVEDRTEDAVNVLWKIVAANGKDRSMFPANLKLKPQQKQVQGGARELFYGQWWQYTLSASTVHGLYYFCYYTCILLIQAVETNDDDDDDSGPTCSFNYGFIFASAFGEVAGMVFLLFAIDRLGRKACGVGLPILGSILLPVLTLYSNGGFATQFFCTIAAFVARAAWIGAVSTIDIWVPELYPTELRSSISGVTWCVGNFFGALAAYYVSVGSERLSNFALGGVAGLVGLSMALACLLLFPETTGISLENTILNNCNDAAGDTIITTTPTGSAVVGSRRRPQHDSDTTPDISEYGDDSVGQSGRSGSG